MKTEHKRCSNVVLTSSKPIKRCGGAEGHRDQWSSFGGAVGASGRPLEGPQSTHCCQKRTVLTIILPVCLPNLTPNSLSFYKQIKLTLKINDILLALWLFAVYVSDLIKIEKRKYQNDLHYQE